MEKYPAQDTIVNEITIDTGNDSDHDSDEGEEMEREQFQHDPQEHDREGSRYENSVAEEDEDGLNEDEDDFDQEELDCMTDQAIQSNWDDGIGINTDMDGERTSYPGDDLFTNPCETLWEGYTEEDLIAIVASNAGEFKEGLRGPSGAPRCGCKTGCRNRMCSCKNGKNGNLNNQCTVACKCTNCTNMGVKPPPAGFVREPEQPEAEPDQQSNDESDGDKRTVELFRSKKRRKSTELHEREGLCKDCKYCKSGHCVCVGAGFQCGPKCKCSAKICQNGHTLVTGRTNDRKKQGEWVCSRQPPQQSPASARPDPTPEANSFDF